MSQQRPGGGSVSETAMHMGGKGIISGVVYSTFIFFLYKTKRIHHFEQHPPPAPAEPALAIFMLSLSPRSVSL